jgi:hypothetical protein
MNKTQYLTLIKPLLAKPDRPGTKRLDSRQTAFEAKEVILRML